MTRLFINTIQPQTQIDEVYRVTDKQHRANRQGNMYLLLQLSDRSGTISGMRWNADARLYESFQKGDFLRIQGAAQLHNGQLQLIVNQLQLVDPQELNPEDFDQLDRVRVDQLWTELGELIGSMKSEQLKVIGEAFYNDANIERLFKLAPAGVKTHHAHAGGLLTHVVELMNLASLVATRYQHIDRDMLLLGTMLHDIGKLEELSFEGELTYSDPGQLIGHLVQGVQMLDRKIVEVEHQRGSSLDRELVWRLQHMIVSHHGHLEHGSPRVPMTLEAIVLHYLDDMDAKVNAATEFIRADRNSDSPWTSYHTTLGRKLYKPSVITR
ncbi:MAG: OB-fold nucleic acid binding domain-containing protein [Pirellulaceae bacterium]|nr:OB-fold nucleic acid binding domain-containing protein [Pirellulaceae bacterium]